MIPGLEKKVTKWLLCDQIIAQLSLFMKHSQIVHQTEQLLKKNYFDSMVSLESDEMTALWSNDSLTFPFYGTFSISVPDWTTFVKEVFWFHTELGKWRNDCFVTKWQLNFHFLWKILKWYTELNNFCKRTFLIQGLVKKVTKWLPCDQMIAYLSLFMRHSQIVYQTEQLLLKKCFD